ncbi:MAG TPA: hypothetical protein PLY70_14790 [Saprospiraceae bacterium]|nr:hypothetical protein [Saprospiraceae bacterium]HPN69919.1 hypothetical protein [Saprospiraceae bacterium]
MDKIQLMLRQFSPSSAFGIYAVISIAFSLFIAGCAKAPNYSPIPELTYQGLNKVELKQGEFNTDSLSIQVSFKDGDGDIGTTAETEEPNLIIVDSRTNQNYASYKVPPIPLQGANNGIEGTMLIKIYSTCCRFPDGTPPCLAPPKFPTDKLSLDIYLVDKAGNKSNVIKTGEITLLCQ